MSTMVGRTENRILDSGWQWKEDVQGEDERGLLSQWMDVHTFPSEVHLELMHRGFIPDPYVGFNEHEVQWVGETQWLYRCAFQYERDPEKPFATLVFEGLDTLCDVYLNGNLILKADNMFREYKVELAPGLLEPTNTIVLRFKSAKHVAKELESKYGKVRAGSTNLGDPSRVYVRKAQYDWRWDWGPELMTCGPYRPIRLITYTARISSTRIYAHLTKKPELKPQLSIEVDFQTHSDEKYTLTAFLHNDTAETTIATKEWSVSGTRVSLLGLLDGAEEEVDSWWPVGYGKQTLYELELELIHSSGILLDRVTKSVGFRRVDLVQEPLSEADRYGNGTTFLFEVNGVRMFMGGSNWIPADNFLTRMTPERYRAWLSLLRDGNQNMVRVWGGGIYEPDEFYDICDELGILVWQDFQFACGVYPAHTEFVESVRQEALYNVERLLHHPCVALWCGNNEDYQQLLQWGDVTDLPARVLYEQVLPNVVEVITKGLVPYHRGSPYGGKGWDTSDPTVGDVHQWDIWGGKELPWQNYGKMGGRFVSEFGMPAMPDMRTIEYWLDGDESQSWSQSPLMAQHCRAGAHERRFAIAMNENFRLTEDLETHAYYTQIMQSEAVSLAYRLWRREWRGKGKEYCAGALVWQLNDCWPVTSWSLADYFVGPKPAYYTVKRELAPMTVGILRTVKKNRPNDRPDQFYEFGAFQSVGATLEIWGTNSTLAAVPALLEIRAFDLRSDWTYTENHDVVLAPNQSTEFVEMDCPSPPAPEEATIYARSPPRKDLTHRVVVAARLLDPHSREVIARFADWPQPYRYTDYPDPGLDLLMDTPEERVTIIVDKPAKGLVLSIHNGDTDAIEWGDNALDVMPGDPQVISVKGTEGPVVTIGWQHMQDTIVFDAESSSS